MKTKKLRQYALVKLREDCKHGYEKTPIYNEGTLIYLGEIPNMLGHAVFAGAESGKLYSGYHPESFRELTDEEV